MNENLNPSYLDISIDLIGESFGRFRLLSPRHEATMERSVGRFGQLTPVVVSAAKNDRYEMVDGFRRLRACRKLGNQSLKARVLEGHGRVLKAAMVQLNRKSGHLGDVEEAMIVASLYRDDGLTQVEIAPLLGRDTVRRILRKNKARRDSGHNLLLPTLPRGSKLDAFMPKIRELLATYPDITGVRRFEELQEVGCQGGISILRGCLRSMRRRPKRNPIIRFETDSGIQGQMD